MHLLEGGFGEGDGQASKSALKLHCVATTLFFLARRAI